ncbi:hypothetical protein M758_7G125600 [Ceratodon purpureus]|uniref:Uncharacterized protein n=1 Tax=Ceratodon purpureus TaxID=3225 RepID=A0A8T0HAG9_CERPU|nr:hypothetical protein KC19_7G151700 [Ceratodon purpureus]KAG0611237.1 hypothetical protein M758_7G125600 [Ceratodon purpureus]
MQSSVRARTIFHVRGIPLQISPSPQNQYTKSSRSPRCPPQVSNQVSSLSTHSNSRNSLPLQLSHLRVITLSFNSQSSNCSTFHAPSIQAPCAPNHAPPALGP